MRRRAPVTFCGYLNPRGHPYRHDRAPAWGLWYDAWQCRQRSVWFGFTVAWTCPA